MRNFLILLSFMLVLGCVKAGFAEQMQPATTEEEAAAKATFGQIFQDFEDGASKDEIIQRDLQLRDQYPNTRLTAAMASSGAGFLYYQRQYKLQEAAECYEWVLNRYPDLPDSLWEMEDPMRDVPEEWWKAWKLRQTYAYTVVNLANIYFSMGRFEEAAALYHQIQEKPIYFGPGSSIRYVLKLSKEDLQILKTQCLDYQRLQNRIYPMLVFQERRSHPGYYALNHIGDSLEFAEMMLCLIKQKHSEEETE